MRYKLGHVDFWLFDKSCLDIIKVRVTNLIKVRQVCVTI